MTKLAWNCTILSRPFSCIMLWSVQVTCKVSLKLAHSLPNSDHSFSCHLFQLNKYHVMSYLKQQQYNWTYSAHYLLFGSWTYNFTPPIWITFLDKIYPTQNEETNIKINQNFKSKIFQNNYLCTHQPWWLQEFRWLQACLGTLGTFGTRAARSPCCRCRRGRVSRTESQSRRMFLRDRELNEKEKNDESLVHSSCRCLETVER